MSTLRENRTKLQSILDAVNELPYSGKSIRTCSVTLQTEGNVLLRMYTAPIYTDNGADIVFGSNMMAGVEAGFTTPITIDNVIIGVGVTFMFSGAILGDTKIEGDATVTPLGTNEYIVKPNGNCVVTCYDRD